MKGHHADLWERVTSHDALQAAWARVDSNEGSAGGDGVSRGEFRSDLFARLTQLRADLLSGAYTARPFRKVSIPKKKPGYRILTIPGIRDRVVHTSIASALTPIFEPVFEDSSFGYRPGRGVSHAVRRIEQWRDRGYSVVIEADIVRYFDNVQHDLLLEKIEAVIGSLPGAEPLLGLIRRILAEQAKALKTEGVGLVQGSPLSPLLANLYLDALDEEIENQGVKLVRFADDFVILCKSKRKAERVLDHVVKVLADHGLALHADGTRIVNFDKGFDFIGYLFLRTLALKDNSTPASQPTSSRKVKSEVTDEGVIKLDDDGSRFDQGKRVLYVLDEDHRLSIRNRSFSVRRDDNTELIAIPHRRIGRIEIGPGVDFARPAVELAMDANIDVAVLDGLGQTKGAIFGRTRRRAGLHLAQAKAVLDDSFRVAVSRHLVAARIRNQRTQIMRLNRDRKLDEASDGLSAMKEALDKTAAAKSVNELMGLEGASTAVYWPTLGLFIKDEASKSFSRQRPARDPLNAAINYLTGILERDVRAAIQSAELHVGFAFLHGTRDRHDGLVFDLMEPFRAPLCEGLPVFLFNARRLRAEMFAETTSSGVEISAEGRRGIVEAYESAVGKRVEKPDGGGKLGWRAMMVHQSRSLARAVRAETPDLFVPYVMKP